jgi:hypothetical protein
VLQGGRMAIECVCHTTQPPPPPCKTRHMFTVCISQGGVSIHTRTERGVYLTVSNVRLPCVPYRRCACIILQGGRESNMTVMKHNSCIMEIPRNNRLIILKYPLHASSYREEGRGARHASCEKRSLARSPTRASSMDEGSVPVSSHHCAAPHQQGNPL